MLFLLNYFAILPPFALLFINLRCGGAIIAVRKEMTTIAFRHIAAAIVAAFVAVEAAAQTERADSLPALGHDDASPAAYMAATDSMHLPPIDHSGRVATVAWPYYNNVVMGYPWRLHEGMNVSLGAFVATAFGKNAPSGAGFGQNAALLYALPLGNRLSVAAGAYLNNLSWGGAAWREVGLSAILSYRFNNHWEAAVYGNKALANRYSSPLFRANPSSWAMPYSVGDRIGASLTYNFTPSMSIQLSVERVSLPRNKSAEPPYGERR